MMEMSEKCNHEWQNIGLAFCTIPETEMQACIHCGEQRGHQEPLDDKTKVELQCDICQKPMTMAKQNGKAIFECTGKECHQTWLFSKTSDGKIESSSTVLKHLWPSRMKEGDKMFREEFLPERLKEWNFSAMARHLAGFITEEEMLKDFAESEQTISDWFENNPEIIQTKKSWRERLFGI